MPERQIAPVIESQDDFELKLPNFLDENKTLAILLDYDGTLAPITSNPSKTVMHPTLETVLRKLAKHPNIFMAVISGRGLRDVQKCVGIDDIYYGGNHGLEIEYPDGSRHDYQLPEAIQKSYKAMLEELKANLNKHNAWVEDKLVSLTYHYREAPSNEKEALKAICKEIIERHGFRASQAHEAIEAKPPVNWNKGEAALHILKSKFGELWAQDINVIFAGDDTTDEDAMRMLQGLGKSFRISENPEIQTYADFRLPKQDLVTDLLKWIASVYRI